MTSQNFASHHALHPLQVNMAAVFGRVFIYGGRGALGAACVAHFKAQNWWVASIDLKANDQADANVLVKHDENWVEQESSVVTQVASLLNGEKIDAIICVAGGWAGGNAASKDPDVDGCREDISPLAKYRKLVKNADLMWRQSVWSSTIAASIAAQFLKDGGMISLPGAKPALGSTPGMIGYGMAKAAVHQLTKLFLRWTRGEERPPNGSLVHLVTKNFTTELLLV
ncbi:Dihydropteridine reductase [Blattella germanica]|nr:Dihydropteridine reductase [Blattella germanica]